jgi:hypothetical protein
MFAYNEKFKTEYLAELAETFETEKNLKPKYYKSNLNIGDSVTFKTNRTIIKKHSYDGACWDPETGIIVDKFNRTGGFGKDIFQVDEVLVIKLSRPHNFFTQGIKTDLVFTNLLDRELKK